MRRQELRRDVLKAAVEKAGWQSRPSPRRDQTGDKVSGRGLAYAQRNGTRVAVVAEVDVDRQSGKIFARKFTVAHDCGQIINPKQLVKAIEGNIVQGVSRTLWEEVQFDDKAVTSVDVDVSDPRYHRDAGTDRRRAGQSSRDRALGKRREPSIRPVAAAIANTIFDATGVRIRRVPVPQRSREGRSPDAAQRIIPVNRHTREGVPVCICRQAMTTRFSNVNRTLHHGRDRGHVPGSSPRRIGSRPRSAYRYRRRAATRSMLPSPPPSHAADGRAASERAGGRCAGHRL